MPAKAATKPTTKPETKGRKREIAGIALLGFGIFSLLALISMHAGSGRLMGPGGAATASGLYTLAGFVLLLWYAKRELPRMLEEQLQRRAHVGEISFNPFTLALEADDFALTERDGRPLVSFKHAVVDVEWRSLAQRAIVFGEIRLDAPALHVAISPVLLGRGERLFEGTDLRAAGFECVQFVASEKATHVVLRRRGHNGG